MCCLLKVTFSLRFGCSRPNKLRYFQYELWPWCSFSWSKHRHTICFGLYENGWVHLDSPPACSSLLCSIMTWRLTHTALVGFAALPVLCWHRWASVTAVKQWPVIADHVLSHPDIAALNNCYHFHLSRALMSIRKTAIFVMKHPSSSYHRVLHLLCGFSAFINALNLPLSEK